MCLAPSFHTNEATKCFELITCKGSVELCLGKSLALDLPSNAIRDYTVSMPYIYFLSEWFGALKVGQLTVWRIDSRPASSCDDYMLRVQWVRD